jgi:hypothetical protein
VGERHVRPGNLVDAVNVKVNRRLQYSKRDGFSRTLPSLISSGGFTFTQTTDTMGLVPGPNGTMFTLDGAGRAWCYDPDVPALRDRGLLTRSFPQHTTSISAAKLARPTVVIAGGNRWTFAFTTNAYWYTVEDLSTGVVIQPPTKISASCINLAAAYDNTNVWVILVDTSDLRDRAQVRERHADGRCGANDVSHCRGHVLALGRHAVARRRGLCWRWSWAAARPAPAIDIRITAT